MSENISLRQLSVGELLDKAFQIYRSQFISLAGITAAVFIPTTILKLFAVVIFGDTSIADLIQNGFITNIAVVSLIAAISQAYLFTPATIRDSFSLGLRRYWSVFGASFIIGLVLAIPLVVFGICLIATIPGLAFVMIIFAFPVWIYLFTRWSVFASSIVLEDIGASEGLRRSWNLTANHFWRVLGTSTAAAILVYIIAAVPTLFLVYVSEAVGISSLVSAIIQTILSQLILVFTMPLSTAVQVLIYYDLRIRVEGFDLAYKAERLNLEATDQDSEQ